MPRKSTAAPITLGFIGSGKVTQRNVNALLSDVVDAAEGGATFILPVAKTTWNPGIQAVADFANENEIEVEAVTDSSAAKVRSLKEFLGTVEKQYPVQRIANKIVNILEKADDGTLIVLWDEDDAEAGKAVDRAQEKEIPVLDLTSSLSELTFDEEAEDDEETEDEDESEEEYEDDEEEDDEYEDDEEVEDEDEETNTVSAGTGDADSIVEAVLAALEPTLTEIQDAVEALSQNGQTTPKKRSARR